MTTGKFLLRLSGMLNILTSYIMEGHWKYGKENLYVMVQHSSYLYIKFLACKGRFTEEDNHNDDIMFVSPLPNIIYF